MRGWVLSLAALIGCSPENIQALTLPSDSPQQAFAAPLVVPLQISHSRPATSCESVAHIGDSTSVHLQIGDLYSSIGVRHLSFEAAGGRSIIEHRSNRENGPMVASRLIESGFSGCWVIALGTNDAANIARGSRRDAEFRINRMMSIIGDSPALWVDSATTTVDGYYASPNMAAWNESLDKVLAGFPMAKVYRWSDDVVPGWLVADGIHYTKNGNKERGEHIVMALARAFPDHGAG